MQSDHSLTRDPGLIVYYGFSYVQRRTRVVLYYTWLDIAYSEALI